MGGELEFMEASLDKETKRKAEKIMRSYRNINAIIEAQRMELPQRMTTSYGKDEAQRGNQFHSETERVALLRIKIGDHLKMKKKLDYIYRSLTPTQQRIWDLRYSDGRYDVDVYTELELTERTYYRLKKDMIKVVAEAFCLWQNNAVKAQ